MAMSKPKFEVNTNCVTMKLNKVHGEPLVTLLDKQEIEQMCYLYKKNVVSVDIIHHMLGGKDMDYRCIELEESFEVFDYVRKKIVL